MPTFSVLCRVDSFANYEAEVEAGDEAEAARIAGEQHGKFQWKQRSTTEFDARVYVTLDADGNEIESTQCGDF